MAPGITQRCGQAFYDWLPKKTYASELEEIAAERERLHKTVVDSTDWRPGVKSVSGGYMVQIERDEWEYFTLVKELIEAKASKRGDLGRKLEEIYQRLRQNVSLVKTGPDADKVIAFLRNREEELNREKIALEMAEAADQTEHEQTRSDYRFTAADRELSAYKVTISPRDRTANQKQLELLESLLKEPSAEKTMQERADAQRDLQTEIAALDCRKAELLALAELKAVNRLEAGRLIAEVFMVTTVVCAVVTKAYLYTRSGE